MTNASILESLEESSKDLGKLDDGSLSSLGSKCHEIESTVAELENIESHKKVSIKSFRSCMMRQPSCLGLRIHLHLPWLMDQKSLHLKK